MIEQEVFPQISENKEPSCGTGRLGWFLYF